MTQHYSPYPHQEPPKKRKKWPYIAGGAAILVIAIGAAGAAGSGGDSTATAGNGTTATTQQAPDAPAGKVVFELIGEGKASNVSYSDVGSMSNLTDVKLPFKKVITPSGGMFDYYSLTAMNGSDGGKITCRITVKGEVIAEESATGQYASVICNSEL